MPSATLANAIVAKVAADLSEFQRGMMQAQKYAKSAGQKVANAFKIAVAAVATLGVSAVALGKKIFDVGSAVLETRSKFETVFGAATASVDAFIAEFGTLAGLSKSQAEGILATTGAVAQGFGFAGQASAAMAEQMVRLGADLSSFNNLAGGTAEGVDIITRTMTGEFERAKSVGVVIRALEVDQRALANTGKTAAKALTEQERVTARLQLFTERAGVAVGDLARTQDSAANRARQLSAQVTNIKEQLSVAFLPVITENVLPALENLVGWFKSNQEQIVRFGTAFIEVGKVLVSVAAKAFNLVGSYLGDLGALLVGVFTFDFNMIKTAVIDFKNVMVTNVKEIIASFASLGDLPAKMDAAVAGLTGGGGGGEGGMGAATKAAKEFHFEIKEIPRRMEEVSLAAVEVGPHLVSNLVLPTAEANNQTYRLVSHMYDTAIAARSVVGAVKAIVKELFLAVAKAIALKAVMKAIEGPAGGFLKKIPIIGGLFQQGGIVPGIGGPVPIIAHAGEGVLTREAVLRLGGPQAIQNLNANLSFPGITDVTGLRRNLPGIVKDLRRKGRI